ncbi:hypothetical protein [Acetonema longum]|uniref:Outer membrane protein beta-barrel domain-containing protein n=1 Tax=Acetonema longum DSM 6540 TaxID=1009370 RepID=F7NF31_9FIRM|nr:hypothetical protein [Acetonema longum]EGO65286.1 hypothetical protein ALO_03281 [Acetonema longum DSM 6540]
MRSVIVLCMIWGFLACTVWAAPLTDYSPGSLALDVSLRTVENESDHAGGTHNTYGARSGLDFGATLGLGGRWALQYRGLNAKSQDLFFSETADGEMINPVYESFTGRMRLKTDEVSLLYRWNQYYSLFAGSVSAKAWFPSAFTYRDPFDSQDDVYLSETMSTRTKTTAQFGVIGSMPLASKLTGYASLGVGKDVASWGVGISYRVTRDMDFNLDYRKLTVKGLRLEDAKIEAETGGMGFGVTWRL